jgi:hypothetical protein
VRNHGEQPIAAFLKRHGLRAHDLVAQSPEPITHKMVSRACKGRRLTARARNKLIRACEAATGESLRKRDLFTY